MQAYDGTVNRAYANKLYASAARGFFSIILFFGTMAGVAGVAVDSPAFTVGAAPKGDAGAVAARIIRHNFPECRRVSGATRRSDGSIRAQCEGKDYLVFTVFNAKEGRLMELALNCTAARNLLQVSC